MDVYLRTIYLLRRYFEENTEALFLHGGCFFLADFLHQQIHTSDIMINRQKEHCGIRISYHGLYDITGRIAEKEYRVATKRDISFMKKNYIPKFDKDLMEQYLYEQIRNVNEVEKRAGISKRI